MGYHISEIAKRGPDGGIDIIAYNDPWELSAKNNCTSKHKPTTNTSPTKFKN